MLYSYTVRNVEAAAEYVARQLGTVLVTFPFNDYLVAGKCRTCEPKVRCKLHYKRGKVFVRFDRRMWLLKAEAYQFAADAGGKLVNKATGKPYRAHLLFKTAGVL